MMMGRNYSGKRRPAPLGTKVLHAVFWTIGKVDRTFFSWLDAPMLRRREKALRQDVAEKWSSLIARKHGVFTEVGKPSSGPAFDYATVVLEFPDVMIRVIRGRGELSVQYASLANSESWDEVSLMVRRTEMVMGAPLSGPVSDLSVWETTIERFWPYLIAEAA